MNELLKDWNLSKIQREIKLVQEHDVFVVVDIETVGFTPVENRGIIEIAAVRVEKNHIIDRFHSFVNPEMKIPNNITKITGITDKDVKFAPKLTTVLWAFKIFLGEDVVVCHNAKFDWDTFLRPLMNRVLIKTENQVLCTLRTFQRAMPGLGKGSYTNEQMALLFGYSLAGAHRADADVEATAQSLMGLKRWFDQVNLEAIRKENQKKADGTKEETAVSVESVNFWEKTFGETKQIKRQYVRVRNEAGVGTVFYDLISRVWKNKDFPKKLNFDSVEKATLAFLGLKDIHQLETYRG